MSNDSPWGLTPEDETRYCKAIAVPGRMYLSNGDPGYPDEGCDEEAEEDSDYCAKHRICEDDEIDPDEAWKRRKLGDDY